MADERYGERIAILETNQKNLTDTVNKMAIQLDEVHSLLLKAKGAKWAIIGMATLGGFLSAKLAAAAAFLGFLPSSK